MLLLQQSSNIHNPQILIVFFFAGCNALSHKIGPHKSSTVTFGQLPVDISSFIAKGEEIVLLTAVL